MKTYIIKKDMGLKENIGHIFSTDNNSIIYGYSGELIPISFLCKEGYLQEIDNDKIITTKYNLDVSKISNIEDIKNILELLDLSFENFDIKYFKYMK